LKLHITLDSLLSLLPLRKKPQKIPLRTFKPPATMKKVPFTERALRQPGLKTKTLAKKEPILASFDRTTAAESKSGDLITQRSSYTFEPPSLAYGDNPANLRRPKEVDESQYGTNRTVTGYSRSEMDEKYCKETPTQNENSIESEK
jgi:hypothetical protein